ncbi:MAG: hypothetical protein WCB10_15210 [Steroidobacteraceae bacterium]
MDTSEISDFDIAIIDAIKTVIEVLAQKGVATHEAFAVPFRHQMQTAQGAHNAAGASVFQLLLQFCESHGPVHALHRAPPGGSA